MSCFTMTDSRLIEAQDWLHNQLRLPITHLKPIVGDASFRRYFRAHLADTSYILMDAPPEKENTRLFCLLSEHLQEGQLSAPRIIAYTESQGFMLLEDFGSCLFNEGLNSENADERYSLALKTLVTLQQLPDTQPTALPRFDEAMMEREMQLFVDWFLPSYCHYRLSDKEEMLIKQSFKQITTTISTFPYCFVHRDYHSRNLMLLKQQRLGILDFQDAVWGPITYDVLSLLKDCYIDWPEAKRLDWLSQYHYMLMQSGHFPWIDFSLFHRQFEWVGIQRHLKVAGIFTRLNERDHKPHYLSYLPRTLTYLLNALSTCPELDEFYQWLSPLVRPYMEKQSA